VVPDGKHLRGRPKLLTLPGFAPREARPGSGPKPNRNGSFLLACLSIPKPSRFTIIVAKPYVPLFLLNPANISRLASEAKSSGVLMTTISFKSEVFARGVRMLRSALGPAISGYLDDPDIVEVMLNPDGKLWIDRLSGGLKDTGCRVTPSDAERIVRLVAHHVGVEVHAGSPRVSAELPESGERFEGLMPPVVAAPCFAIRRPAVAVFTLSDYVDAGIMLAAQAELLRAAVRERKNVLIAGGTSTGKTTLVNALLAEIAKTGERIVLIEDTRELQCSATNLVALRTKDGTATLSDLVRSSLRLRPDRIPIGEVRGAEALDLLKAWGTGHPGGVGTLHAGSAIGALHRLEQLIQEATVTVPRALIAETIDIIAVLSGRGSARRLAELGQVKGLSAAGDYVLTPAGES
jgi:P-type conjugative transfer ATPase TrbB